MKFNYISIFKVEGVTLPEGVDEVIVGRSENPSLRVILTRNIDAFSNELDTHASLGALMIGALGGKSGPEGTPQERLQLQKAVIAENRKKKIGTNPALVFQGTGEIQPDLSHPLTDYGHLVVTFDAFKRNEVTALFEKEIDKAATAIFLTSNGDFSVEAVGEVIWLINEDNKAIYSISFDMSATVIISNVLTPDAIGKLEHYWELLHRDLDTQAIQRLLRYATDKNVEPFRAFLAAWISFEIFINKLFKFYEDSFLNTSITVDRAPVIVSEFIKRLKEVMTDKYRLRDKFIVIASTLSPSTSEDDLASFGRMKKLRDLIMHGEKFNEKELPTAEIVKMLKRYLMLHLEAFSANTPLERAR